jgi:hypothetical protein
MPEMEGTHGESLKLVEYDVENNGTAILRWQDAGRNSPEETAGK